MIRTYKFRLYPTCPQRDRLAAMLQHHCDLYNAALEHRRDAYRRAGVTVTGYRQMLELTEMRAESAEIAAWSVTSQQQTIRRLDGAFAAFFRRVKAGQQPGYPRFRPIRRFDSVSFRQSSGGTLTPPASGRTGSLRIKNVGVVKVRMHRPLPAGAKVGRITVRREGFGVRARWYVTVPVEVFSKTLPTTGRKVGVDLGVASLLTASEVVPGLTDADGHAPNPRHVRTATDKLIGAQRELSRCKRGSNRRRKARDRIAALHCKVHRQRVDVARKVALALVRHADVIVLEKLQPTKMVRRAKPVPNGDGTFAPNGAAAKSGLNRSIHDAGWGVLTRAILAKAEEAGREVVFVNPANTSRHCARCGHTAAGNRVTQAKFECLACGHVDHADRNAALNILRAGTAHQAAMAA